jgi:hypothetical protein
MEFIPPRQREGWCSLPCFVLYFVVLGVICKRVPVAAAGTNILGERGESMFELAVTTFHGKKPSSVQEIFDKNGQLPTSWSNCLANPDIFSWFK